MKLGKSIDIYDLNNQILAVPGVGSIRTQRTDNPNISVEGLGLVAWSMVYGLPRFVTSRLNLEFFEFGYFQSGVSTKIRINETASNLSRAIQY